MKSDIEIAKTIPLRPIEQIGEILGIPAADLELYGKYKAKIPLSYSKLPSARGMGKLILVSAISPTPLAKAKPLSV